MRLKVKRKIIVSLGLLILLAILPVAAAGQDQYIVRCSPLAVSAVVSRHGMTLLRSLEEYNFGIYLVRSPAGAVPPQYISEVGADPDVQAVEPNGDVVVPETPSGVQLGQSTASILDMLANPTVVTFFGTPVLSSYVNQPAA